MRQAFFARTAARRADLRWRPMLIWVGLLAVLLLLRTALPAAWIERVYSRGFFLGVRWVLDTLVTWSPVALIYLFWPLLVVGVVRRIRIIRRRARTRGVFWGQLLVSTVGFLAAGLCVFLLIWAFNYGRLPVEEVLGLPEITIDLDRLGERVRAEAAELAVLRAALPGADTSRTLPEDLFPARPEAALRPPLEEALAAYGYPTTGRVRGRLLYPKGVFLRFSSAGLYWPFVGEGHIDAGLLPLQRPAVVAHELAHGYGFADEGTCSFWAYLAGLRSEDAAVRYAVRLDYWRDIAGTYRRYRNEEYTAWRTDSLDNGIRHDLEAIYANNELYPDLLPAVRYAAYDAYLKSQGVEEGIKSYGRVIDLVEAWLEGGFARTFD
ncbi:MAG: DUF3810 family protein [Saprospiraceae bacterium]